MPSWCFADTMQVTVKFGAHHLVINEIASATLGKELKSLVRTRLRSCLPRNAQFQIKSQENGRILRVLETLGEVSMLCFETKHAATLSWLFDLETVSFICVLVSCILTQGIKFHLQAGLAGSCVLEIVTYTGGGGSDDSPARSAGQCASAFPFL